MPKFTTLGSNSETSGKVMLSFINCSKKEDILPYLRKHNLDHIDPDAWYPHQVWLDVVNDIAENAPGQAMFDMVSIGMSVVDNAILPPEFDDLPFEQVLLRWSKAYHMNNRGPDAGDIQTEMVGPKHIKMIHRVPYPDDFLYGVLYGRGRRFLPPGTGFQVYYDETLPRRDDGGETTVIHIEWD